MKQSAEAFEWLNYHHLRYFWMIARQRSMKRAAQVLNVSQSSLSAQLRALEERLGQPLFERRSRQLFLTEAGRVAFEHAESIFKTGRELLDRFRQTGSKRAILRIGAVGPLSKNLQFDFIEPLLADGNTIVSVTAGALTELVRQLHEHKLDIVLSNMPLRVDEHSAVHNHLLGETPVFLAGRLKVKSGHRRFPQWLRGIPLLLPSRESHVRADFELLLADAGVEPEVRAEVDDMALLRLLALSGRGLALVSNIVVERELQTRKLATLIRVPGLSEKFYAITIRRRFPNALIEHVVVQMRAHLKETLPQ